MDWLMIKYDTGYMDLKVDAFFPCTQSKAKIVFPLINRWCSDLQISMLKAHFEKQIELLTKEMKDLANKACSYPAKSTECRKYTAAFKKCKTKCERYKKNLMQLKGSDE